MIRICICGGGSLGHVLISVLSKKGCCINLLTNHPESWNKQIEVVDTNDKKYIGIINCISNNPVEVVPNSDIILLCVPGFLIDKTLKSIAPYISSQVIGSIVSSTGFFFRAHEIFPSNIALFGFQRVPFIARVENYGRSAKLLGYKSQLFMAVENLSSDFVTLWSQWLETPISKLNNYLEASLTNSNPLLHPARIYGLWHDWHPGIYYPNNAYFYADWDDFSSQIYIDCDKEFQILLSKLGITIPPVLEYYESDGVSALTRKLSTISAFKTILAPMRKESSGFIPDFTSRYFLEDFPFGIQIIKDLAVANMIDTPTIDTIINWKNNL